MCFRLVVLRATGRILAWNCPFEKHRWKTSVLPVFFCGVIVACACVCVACDSMSMISRRWFLGFKSRAIEFMCKLRVSCFVLSFSGVSSMHAVVSMFVSFSDSIFAVSCVTRLPFSYRRARTFRSKVSRAVALYRALEFCCLRVRGCISKHCGVVSVQVAFD